jgi:hypothetical protein
MMSHSDRPERPRLEPEIIPPARSRRASDWQQRVWHPQTSTSEMHRIYVARLGPFGMAMLMLVIGIVIAIILLATIGAILVWIPILALLLAAGVVYRLLRRREP